MAKKMKSKKVMKYLDKAMKPYKEEMEEFTNSCMQGTKDYQYSVKMVAALKAAKKAVKENKELKKRIKDMENPIK